VAAVEAHDGARLWRRFQAALLQFLFFSFLVQRHQPLFFLPVFFGLFFTSYPSFSLFLISRLSLYSFPVLFPCLSPFCSVSLLFSFSLSAFVFFFLFFAKSNPSPLFFFSSSFFFPHLPSSLSPGIYKEEKGEIGLLPYPVMAQG